MTVYEKLQEVQSRLSCPKGQYNSFGGFAYRSLEDIMVAVKPLLQEVGAVLTISDDVIGVNDRVYIKAVAKFTDIESGETVENMAFARETAERKGMDSSQITGAASSYARKYAVGGLLLIDDTKDADTMNNTPKKLGAKYVSSLKGELSRTGISERSLLNNYGVNDLSELSFAEYEEAMAKLESKPAKAA